MEISLTFLEYAALLDLFKVAAASWGVIVSDIALLPAWFAFVAVCIGGMLSVRLACFPPHVHQKKRIVLPILFAALAVTHGALLILMTPLFPALSAAVPVVFLAEAALFIALLVTLALFGVEISITMLVNSILMVGFMLLGAALFLGAFFRAFMPEYLVLFFSHAFILLAFSYAVVFAHRLCESRMVHAPAAHAARTKESPETPTTEHASPQPNTT